MIEVSVTYIDAFFIRELVFSSAVDAVYGTLVSKEIKMQGFIATTQLARYPEWIKQHIEWINEVKTRI